MNTQPMDEAFAMGKIAGVTLAANWFMQAAQAAQAMSQREAERLRKQNRSRCTSQTNEDAA